MTLRRARFSGKIGQREGFGGRGRNARSRHSASSVVVARLTGMHSLICEILLRVEGLAAIEFHSGLSAFVHIPRPILLLDCSPPSHLIRRNWWQQRLLASRRPSGIATQPAKQNII